MPKIVITGGSGQLGQEFASLQKSFPYQMLLASKDDLDITDFSQIENYTHWQQVSYIINCAAYTHVDKAMIDKERAYKINVEGVDNLLKIAIKHHLKIIHISTDYVFNTKQNKPLKEDSQTNPTGVYGRTKRQGELLLMQSNINYIIVRTSWLYSTFGHNFFKTMLRLFDQKQSLQIVNDQIGTPTYAKDVARIILQILPKIHQGNKGIYHLSNTGQTSWYGFAKMIAHKTHSTCEILPIGTENYCKKRTNISPRPPYSVLDCSKIQHIFGIQIRSWQQAFGDCLSNFKS